MFINDQQNADLKSWMIVYLINISSFLYFNIMIRIDIHKYRQNYKVEYSEERSSW